MTLLKFMYGAHTLQFTHGSEYPSQNNNKIVQVKDRSAGGSLKVETLGINIRSLSLVFEHLPADDYHALVNWYYNISVGAMVSFQMVDEYGELLTVKIVSDEIAFEETYLGTWVGVVDLEVVPI